MLTISAFVFGFLILMFLPILGPFIYSLFCVSHFDLTLIEGFGVFFPMSVLQIILIILMEVFGKK